MSNSSQMDLLSLQKKQNQDQGESQIHSVSSVNKEIKKLLEGQFALLWIRGEISNFKAHSSGHYYFSLKDSKSQINAVMFKGYNRALKFKPKSGDEVIIRGRVSVYEPRGNYQLYCETMEPVGAGALQVAFEKLKAKLKDEGCFEQSRKRPLPALPTHVALVTSPTGAAVRDMLNVLSRRYRGLKITVVPCQVQGKGSEKTIVQALENVEKLNLRNPVDVVICGRGGGSMEDLWSFNEEVLARKIMEMSMPLISAVGHEVDFTIADFVADLRAPTPSAAAELVVKNASELRSDIIQKQKRLLNSLNHQLHRLKQKTLHLSRRLVDPKKALQDKAMKCDDLVQRLELAMGRYLRDRRHTVQLSRQRMVHPKHRVDASRRKLDSVHQRMNSLVLQRLELDKKRFSQAAALLSSLNPLNVVERGYSLATVKGKVLKDSGQVKVGDRVDLRLAKGELQLNVEKIKKAKE